MTRRAAPLNAFHTFVVTARHLNLTHAAAELCLTQGAVSRKIAALEDWLGFPVFERHARGLLLTARGARLLPAVSQGVAMILAAADDASAQHAEIRLRAPTCVLRWLLPRLRRFEQQHPDRPVTLTTARHHSPSLEGVDVVIYYGAPQPEGTTLFAEQLIPVISPDALTAAVDCHTLSHLTFLHPSQDNRDWQCWLAASGIAAEIRRQQHFDTMDLAIGAAIEGFGITVADPRLVENELARGRLVTPFTCSAKTGAVYTLLARQPSAVSALTAILTAD